MTVSHDLVNHKKKSKIQNGCQKSKKHIKNSKMAKFEGAIENSLLSTTGLNTGELKWNFMGNVAEWLTLPSSNLFAYKFL